MKRVFICFLSFALLFSLYGCAFRGEDTKDTVSFFYLRRDFIFGETGGVIAAEFRDASGNRNDLSYLLTLYLHGPLDSELTSPFPYACELMDVQKNGDALTVVFNSALSNLTEIDLTLACTCLADTCMSLTDVQTVHIESHASDGEILLTRTIQPDDFPAEADMTFPHSQTPDA